MDNTQVVLANSCISVNYHPIGIIDYKNIIKLSKNPTMSNIDMLKTVIFLLAPTKKHSLHFGTEHLFVAKLAHHVYRRGMPVRI